MKPTHALLQWLAAWTLGALAGPWLSPAARAGYGVLGVLLLLLLLVDLWRLRRQPQPTAQRAVAGAQPVGAWRTVVLTIANPARRAVPALVYDHHPGSADNIGLPVRVLLPAGGQVGIRYQLRFQERGDHRFNGVELRITGALGLAECRVFIPLAESVRVFPDFAAVARYTLLATDHRLSQIGVRRRQRRGEGMEFHQLREYRRGDALRQIDWKASSRLRKLISLEYQDERDQQLVFLLDCGNRMRAQDERLSHFDQALNALLLLAHVAVRQGDAVGGISFGGENRQIMPRKGPAALGALMDRLFDLQPGLHAPDYRAAATRLASLVRKRSLVLIITNLRDEDGDELLAAVSLLRRRHLVLVASLRESALTRLLATPAVEFDTTLLQAGARLYLDARERTLERLRRQGAQVLDVEPALLPVALVNGYLAIKRGGAL